MLSNDAHISPGRAGLHNLDGIIANQTWASRNVLYEPNLCEIMPRVAGREWRWKELSNGPHIALFGRSGRAWDCCDGGVPNKVAY